MLVPGQLNSKRVKAVHSECPLSFSMHIGLCPQGGRSDNEAGFLVFPTLRYFTTVKNLQVTVFSVSHRPQYYSPSLKDSPPDIGIFARPVDIAMNGGPRNGDRSRGGDVGTARPNFRLDGLSSLGATANHLGYCFVECAVNILQDRCRFSEVIDKQLDPKVYLGQLVQTFPEVVEHGMD